jgi:hypothetical protein
MLLITAVSAYAVYTYSTCMVQIRYHQWMSDRQSELRDFGVQLLGYAEQHDRRLPDSFGDLIAEGTIGPDEIRFDCPLRSIRVCRQFRAVSDVGLAEKLMLVIESYYPPQAHLNVLQLDGSVYALRREMLASAVANDNALRRARGLAELPAPDPVICGSRKQ